jgi:hypothetical protein
MTLLLASDEVNSRRVYIWGLNEAGISAASNNVFDGTYSGSPSGLQRGHAVACFANVDQSAHPSETATNSGTSDPITTSLTGNSGSMGFCFDRVTDTSKGHVWANDWVEFFDSTTMTSNDDAAATKAFGKSTATQNISVSGSGGDTSILAAVRLDPVVAYTLGTFSAASTTQTLEIDTPDHDEGDALLCFVFGSDNQNLTNAESGWTEDHEYQFGATAGSDGVIAAYTKFAGASEPASITINIGGGADVPVMYGVCIAVHDQDIVLVDDSAIVSSDNENSDTVTPPEVTTTQNNSVVFTWIGVNEGTSPVENNAVQPSGHTLVVENGPSTNYSGLSSFVVASATTHTPGSWSGLGTGADSAAVTVAVRTLQTDVLTSIVQSVERVTIDWDATSEPVTQNLSKGQDETRCVPFFTKRLVSGSLVDDFRERTMKVEMIDNGGTPAVRVSAAGKTDADDHRIEVYVVEFVSGITVQQVDADIADAASSANISITDVGAQTDAFFLYSYQYTHGTAQDRADYGCVRPVWNGASTSSITIERTGSTGTIDGMLYVVSCENSEFSVQHRDITVAATDELTNDTITASPMGTTFLLTHFRSSEAEDDPLDWSFVADLSTTTNVRVRRSIAGASNATANVGVQVVTALGGQWSVQRGDFTTTSNLTEQTVISAVDLTRALVKTGTHESGLNSLGTSDLTAGTIIDEVGPAAYLSATNTITWVRESVSETGNTVPYEVIQFSAGLDNAILVPTGPLR